jgi:hypothetical protein
MLIITNESTLETVKVSGKVPAHPDVRDCTLRYGKIVFRPDTIRVRLQRNSRTEPWHVATIKVYGPDVLKSGALSEKNRRERDVEVRGKYIEQYEGSLELFAWARDWAEIMAARANEVTERPVFEDDVALGDPIDLDDTVCVDNNGDEWPEHNFDEYECRRCGAEPEGQ